MPGLYYYTLGVPSKEHRIYYSGLLAIIVVNIVRISKHPLGLDFGLRMFLFLHLGDRLLHKSRF
jgi:hypothetical protein